MLDYLLEMRGRGAPRTTSKWLVLVRNHTNRVTMWGVGCTSIADDPVPSVDGGTPCTKYALFIIIALLLSQTFVSIQVSSDFGRPI